MAYTQCFTHRDYQIAAPIPSVSYFTVEHKYRVLLLAPGGLHTLHLSETHLKNEASARETFL